jgi:hypothetical protein
MSDYHVMTQGEKKKTAQVVMHIPVPNVNNQIGVNYRLALKQLLESTLPEGQTQIESRYPGTGAPELAQLQNGEVYEAVRTYRFSSINLTPAQKQAELDTFYRDANAAVLAEKQDELEYWGYDRDVP